MKLYRCPKCQRAARWTDGKVAALGDGPRDEYWCQTCGEESALDDCEVVRVPDLATPYTEQETTNG